MQTFVDFLETVVAQRPELARLESGQLWLQTGSKAFTQLMSESLGHRSDKNFRHQLNNYGLVEQHVREYLPWRVYAMRSGAPLTKLKRDLQKASSRRNAITLDKLEVRVFNLEALVRAQASEIESLRARLEGPGSRGSDFDFDPTMPMSPLCINPFGDVLDA